uniref:APETALA3-like MADS-box transcription factor AP3b n=1 Tax=Elegia elephantina TaxID=311263 RepID=A0A140HIG6_9POAL|nr:APETALA3-like MADS-box transcription factor AP3b [Elegia elephantina]
MGRGKIEIKMIENPTNRQVTYSKRRTGIMKKAKELTVLCDAEVSIIMFSNSGKCHEYCSPGTDTKKIMNRYQQALGTNLWSEQYESMQRTLSHLKEINGNLRREIRQRMGEDLDGLDFDHLRGLEQNVDHALQEVRTRKYHVISTQTDTNKKKVKNSEEAYRRLLQELGMRDESVYGYVDNAPVLWEHGVSLESRESHMYPYRVVPSQPNLHGMALYGSHELRLG